MDFTRLKHTVALLFQIFLELQCIGSVKLVLFIRHLGINLSLIHISAKDNRPLNFDEFESHISQMLFVSATPNVYEGEHELLRAEQVIRPTGLLDPEISVRPVEGQIDDLISEVNKEIEHGHKVLITTLTKRMAEDLTDYMKELGIRVRYLHSDIDTDVYKRQG